MSKSDTIKAKISVELQPWVAPKFARRAGATDDAYGIPVGELSNDALEDMALAWVRDLYTNAGRTYAPFYKPAKQDPDAD